MLPTQYFFLRQIWRSNGMYANVESPTPQLNEWTHVAVTYEVKSPDMGLFTGYFNGVEFEVDVGGLDSFSTFDVPLRPKGMVRIIIHSAQPPAAGAQLMNMNPIPY